jgi:cobaltochelatase CobT
VLDTARLTRVDRRSDVSALSFKQEDDMPVQGYRRYPAARQFRLDARPADHGGGTLSADILARTLERCGVKVEILGFTTQVPGRAGMSERGMARRRAGRTHPGRLNDLRHVDLQKRGCAVAARRAATLGLMMREGLLKENIDGEALLWAHQRLIGALKSSGGF